MKKIFTGLKPTSDQIHIANYFAAVKPILDYQEDNTKDLTLFIADLHSLNLVHEKNLIWDYTIKQAKIYLACGLDPEKILFFRQSHVAAHAQLQWILTALTHIGYMKRMHAYKDAVAKWNNDDITVGTFCYPILMAADILLYNIDLVPVGKDQKQHIEFARDIAQKFNKIYGETFKLPDALIPSEIWSIPGLDGRKMSKSYNNYIGILDEEKTILKKVKTIVTDNLSIEESKDPDTCNVYNIMKLFLDDKEENEKIRAWYTEWGVSYKDIKMYLYDKVIEFVKPIQDKYNDISDDEVRKMLEEWEKKASKEANKVMQEVMNKVF